MLNTQQGVGVSTAIKQSVHTSCQLASWPWYIHVSVQCNHTRLASMMSPKLLDSDNFQHVLMICQPITILLLFVLTVVTFIIIITNILYYYWYCKFTLLMAFSLYMLGAKYGFAQSMDCAAQTMDPSVLCMVRYSTVRYGTVQSSIEQYRAEYTHTVV